MNQKKLTRILNITLLGVISFSFIFITQMGAIDNMLVGCDGIEQFYTGKNFYDDKSALMNAIMNLPNASPTVGLANPSQMLQGYPFDCNSVTNAVYCLAQKYEMPCKFILTYSFRSDISMKSGHIGIECYDSNFDDWLVLY